MASLGGSTLAILPSHRPQQAAGAVAGRTCRHASSALLALGISLLGALSASAQETITVAWRDKAPYHYRENGVAQGFLLLRAQQVFARAAIPAVFIEEPAKRIWHDFEYGRKSFCSIGWYRLPEREQLAQFSRPLHVDAPQTLLVSPKALPAIQAYPSFAALLRDPTISMGVIDGVSYGPTLDAQIAHSANQVHHATVSPTSLMQMVAANRVDYMLADQADWQYLRSRASGLEKISEYHFRDLPPGLERFIACSKDVAPDLMQRLNQAISAELKAATAP